jgi:hypothetical protein
VLRRSETKKIDRIYKIYRMRRKKINPVNLVNPVYFLRSLHDALRRPEMMKARHVVTTKVVTTP